MMEFSKKPNESRITKKNLLDPALISSHPLRWNPIWYQALVHSSGADGGAYSQQRPLWCRPDVLYEHGQRGIQLFEKSTGPTQHADGVRLTLGKSFADPALRRRYLDEIGEVLGLKRKRAHRSMKILDQFMAEFYSRSPNAPAYITCLASRKRFRTRISNGTEHTFCVNKGNGVNFLKEGDSVKFPGGIGIPVKRLVSISGADIFDFDKSQVSIACSRSKREFTTHHSLNGFGRPIQFHDVVRESHFCLAQRDNESHNAAIPNLQWPGMSQNYRGEYYMTPLVCFVKVLKCGSIYRATRITFEFLNEKADIAQIHWAEYELGTALRISWLESEYLLAAISSAS